MRWKSSLSDPASFPDTSAVEHLETHISHVFLTDRFAYKIKKPVQFDFLDFSTIELRHFACNEELRLNRRLAPDVYLDVVPITRGNESDQLRVEGTGEVVDWAVKMRRLREAANLQQQIQRHKLSRGGVEQIAELLKDFYRRLEPIAVAPEQYIGRIEAHVRGNRTTLLQVEGLPAEDVGRIHSRQLAWMSLEKRLLQERAGDGRPSRIVDGHGDLRPDHIYLEEHPEIIDCIEFNAEFRQVDVADELAFLAMECERIGDRESGETIFTACLNALDDHPAATLTAFYKSYRACVRAKVAGLRSQQLAGNEAAAALSEAQQYLRLADQYAKHLGPPLCIVTRGLMGTGKSTLARDIAHRLGATLLQTDRIRRELFGAPGEDDAYGGGRYTPDNRQAVYDSMFRSAGEQLQQGLSVVLDGTFLTNALRQRAVTLARTHGAAALVLTCQCPPEAAAKRIVQRQRQADNLSDARPQLRDQQQAADEPMGKDLPHCDINTFQPAAAAARDALQCMRRLTHWRIP